MQEIEKAIEEKLEDFDVISWQDAYKKERLRTAMTEIATLAKDEERERVWAWAVENGLTHKECFVKLRDFLSKKT